MQNLISINVFLSKNRNINFSNTPLSLTVTEEFPLYILHQPPILSNHINA